MYLQVPRGDYPGQFLLGLGKVIPPLQDLVLKPPFPIRAIRTRFPIRSMARKLPSVSDQGHRFCSLSASDGI